VPARQDSTQHKFAMSGNAGSLWWENDPELVSEQLPVMLSCIFSGFGSMPCKFLAVNPRLAPVVAY
jgi:hypothetical protein